MSDDELAAIEARAAAATPGPWEAWHIALTDRWSFGNTDTSLDDLYEDDAQFIAHARQDIPALVAEVRRLRAQEAARAQAIRDMARPSSGSVTCSADVRWEVAG